MSEKRFDDRWCACQADGDPMGPWHPYGDTDWCPQEGPVDPGSAPDPAATFGASMRTMAELGRKSQIRIVQVDQ